MDAMEDSSKAQGSNLADEPAQKESDVATRARQEVSSFLAARLDPPWNVIRYHYAPPTAWVDGCDWSVRTGLAVFAGMVYATLPELDDENWYAAPLFTPVIGVAILGFCGVHCLGNVMLVGKLFSTGGLLGSMCAVIVVEAARPVADPGVVSQGRDLVAYLLCAIFFFWFCTRTNLAPPQKKLACALLVLGVGSPILRSFPNDPTGRLNWLWPMKLALTATLGHIIAMLACLLPLPRPALAIFQLQQRAMHHADLVRGPQASTLALVYTCTIVVCSHA